MRTFAQKPQTTHRTASTKALTVSRAHVAQAHDPKSILKLQRTIGNQAVLRLFQGYAEERNALLTGTELPHLGRDCARIPIGPPKAGALQTKLAFNKPGDEYEQEADRVAEHVMRMPEPHVQGACPCGGGCPKCQTESRAHARQSLQTKHAESGALGLTEAPPSVLDVLRSPGDPLDPATRAFMEPRFGHDFSKVRVHTDQQAAAAAESVRAHAFTVGHSLVFGAGRFAPTSNEGRTLVAHELAHVVQQGKGIRRYRNRGAFNFGTLDDAVLAEDSFNARRDKETKPWIKLITVELTSLRTDADGNTYSSGTATAQYYDNPAKLPDLSFTVGGGSRTLGKTDSGTFTVRRLEGIGYNSGSFSGQPGVDFDPAEREGPRKRYSRDLRGNMSFAIFYNNGEALHAGPLDFSSHGCVHVDWTDYAISKQLNYHSVAGLTRVRVKYLPTPAP